DGIQQAVDQAGPVADLAVEFRAAGVNKVVADVVARLDGRRKRDGRLGPWNASVFRLPPAVFRGLAAAGQGQGAVGDLDLVAVAAAGEALDGAAVAVLGGKVLAGVDAGGVVAEDGLDDAGALEEEGPVEVGEQAQAGDGVADGDLVGGLALVLAAEHLGGGGLAAAEALLQPLDAGGGVGAVVAQGLEEAHDTGV